ncbi:class I SAM-dependent methyltransferase [Piscirickettsia litoralis]|uniref:SAM-dependent methyltransferase n=1 Tax=Piscirickettsia litoralis TaxID=1891921 RepID=A0ABX3A4D6_9GAMM|nr:SAM-dependent methyltransferase [Piscirickettsia litoralis]ODN43708.1 SAM-dependent methyltransferase [Piscirickettsia litoralis]
MQSRKQLEKELAELPEPSIEQMAHSQKLIELLQSEINDQPEKVISFKRFMEQTLYAPNLGYYMAGSRKFGAEGDFITAPELSPLFGETLALQAMDILSEFDQKERALLEVGAGSGALATVLLGKLAELDQLPEKYFILELSPELIERQREKIAELGEHILARVEWLNRWPKCFKGMVVANEVLDAMPVHHFEVMDQQAIEIGVSLENNQFCWQKVKQKNASTQAELDRCIVDYQLPNGMKTELNLTLKPWLSGLYDAMEAGLVILIDYGGGAQDIFHPERMQGSLRAFYRHRVHQDVLAYPGLQDITSHVNFTEVAKAADQAGFNIAGFNTQANFLLNAGLLKCIEEKLNNEQEPLKQLKFTQQVKQLTLPTEMGEMFKVMGLTKNFSGQVKGFSVRDLCHSL